MPLPERRGWPTEPIQVVPLDVIEGRRRAVLAEWFGDGDQIPDLCQGCGRGPVAFIWDGPETLGLCHECVDEFTAA